MSTTGYIEWPDAILSFKRFREMFPAEVVDIMRNRRQVNVVFNDQPTLTVTYTRRTQRTVAASVISTASTMHRGYGEKLKQTIRYTCERLGTNGEGVI